MHTHTHIHTRTHTRTHTYTHQVYTYTHSHSHTRTHTLTDTHTHKHTHTQINTHKPHLSALSESFTPRFYGIESYFCLVCLQIEFYFSDTNLPTDAKLLKLISKDDAGFGGLQCLVTRFEQVTKLARCQGHPPLNPFIPIKLPISFCVLQCFYAVWYLKASSYAVITLLLQLSSSKMFFCVSVCGWICVCACLGLHMRQ